VKDMALTNQERAALKGKAQALKCSVTVGKAGLTPAVVEQIRHAFSSAEMVKVRFQQAEREATGRLAQQIAESLPCELVARVGFTATYFRAGAAKEFSAGGREPDARDG
jgi:RNA-binding protein